MNNKRIIWIAMLGIVLVGLAVYFVGQIDVKRSEQSPLRPPSEETSKPELTPTPGSEMGSSATYKDLIEITTPLPKSDIKIVSPLTKIEVLGKARGTWFFEGSFPIELVSGTKGVGVIAKGIAQADGEWMTTEFVPFHAVLTVQMTNDQILNSGGDASIILKKDNPSGDPKNDDRFIVPVQLWP